MSICQPIRALCLLVALANLSLAAAQDALAGRITMALGEVSVLDAAGNTRPVDRLSEIHVGDQLVTGADGIVQMRMADAAIILLRCESRLSIVSYRFQGDSGDRADLLLHAGGLRTITGAIGAGQYRLRTALAELITDATGGDVGLTLVSPSSQAVAVYDGAFRLESPGGELAMGVRADVDFATLESGQAPRGQGVQPAALANPCGGNNGIILQQGV
ncbi:MAG: hypothetical protein WD396_02755 [Pseudohongiellaceae bacterium]